VSWSTDRWQWVSTGRVAGAVAQNDMLQRMISHNRHFGGTLVFQFPFLVTNVLFCYFDCNFDFNIGQNDVATIKYCYCEF
jgi:hypothetical protein